VAQDLYFIGRILKPQGIRGEVKVEPVSLRPERFELLDEVLVGEELKQTYTIEAIRVFKRFALIKFAEIDDRDGAEKLRDKGIFVTKELLLSPGEDEYFVHDLIDCRVSTPTERNIATVIDVMQGGGNDVLVLQDHQNREILVPVVKNVIEKVDIEAKIIIIRSLDAYR
jgi:16S rRNA processing protein RimM